MLLKKFKRYFLPAFICLLSLMAHGQERSSNVQTIDGKKFYIHKIGKSQSVYALARLYNIPIETIYNLNPELRTGARAGQEIKIPFATVPSIAATSPTGPVVDTVKYLTHKVVKSETIYAILRKYNLTEKELRAINPGLNTTLKEGQLLAVGEKQSRVTDPKALKQVITANPSNTIAEAIDSFLFKPISKPRKEKYNVALILPFRLDKTINLDLTPMIRSHQGFPNIPDLAADFYLGFKSAVDSLTTPGFDVNLELYDIDEKDTLKLAQLTNTPHFKELDFIFGPLYANGFKTIAKKAKEISVPIVSPITQQNKILYNNQYISKTNPSQFTLLESLADYCIDSLMSGGANLILVTSGFDKKENNYVLEFKKYFNNRQKLLARPPQDTVKLVKGLAGVKNAFVPNVKNVVVSLSSNQVFIADFTTQLAMFAVGKDLVLCGWENVSTMDNIDQEYLNQLHFTFPHQFNTSNTAAYNKIEESYKAQMNTAPSEYFYIGFDVAYYYLKNLKDSGPDFIYTLNNIVSETNYMRFKFARPDNITGFDNRGVFIFRYHDYHLQKTGWK